MEDYVIVKIRGREVDILCQMSNEYEKYVTMENEKKVLYLRLKNALY